MTDILVSLRHILDEAIDTIVSVCERRNEEFPRLDAPADPSEYSPYGIRNDPVVAQSIKLGVAAASQLIATLQSPIQAAANLGFLATIPGNLAAVERLHVPEIIRKSGEAGMPVSEIVKHNGTSADKLERILRHLATHHVFREVSPGVFAHNRLSSLLDTGKDYDTIVKDPAKKFDNTNGLCAFTSMLTDELSKAYLYTADVLADVSTANSQELNHATLQKALNMNHILWQYLDLPENAFRSRRFNIAMRGISALQPPSKILDLYDWLALPEQATVVDVGSGLGHVSLEIAAVRLDIKFILEDRLSVVAHAKEVLHRAVTYTTLFSSISSIGQNIIRLQCTTHTSLHLRKVADTTKKLVIMDFIVEYACPTSGTPEYATPGDPAPIAPPPLLPNFGVAGAYSYNIDMVMLSYLNAKERTIGAWRPLLDVSGWTLEAVRRDPIDRTGWPLIVAGAA
ncbi:O-methyltransferase [Irpex lacteus]|nr:O-methyltransferase [Irpex lacteus]